MAKAHGLYDHSPTLGRNEDGKVSVKREEKKDIHGHEERKPEEGDEHAASGGLDVDAGHAHSRIAMHHRHVHEHLQLHHQHEVEHSHHKGDKKALHEKHEHEYSQMHDRHHSEMKKLHDHHEKQGTQGETIGTSAKGMEKGAKA